MSTQPQSLDTPVGGEAGIARFVDAFYGRVLADPELKGFFERSPIEKLAAIEREFFRGGAQAGQSSALRQRQATAHYGRGIGKQHLSRFLDHRLDDQGIIRSTSKRCTTPPSG
jgi:hemoglobin